VKMTVLGTGTSFGIPQIGCKCKTCLSDDPRDRRTRVAAVFEDDSGQHRVVVDTPPELRLQLVANEVESVEAVLYTHDHADHVHGIDDLRAISARCGRLPLYGPREVLERITARFTYIFDDGVIPPAGTSKPQLSTVPLEVGEPISVAGMTVVPLECGHGDMRVFGYRIGDFGYLTDVKTVPDETRALLAGVEILVLNALFDQPHPTHLSIPEAIDVARSIGARRTLLTHLTHRYRHAELDARLPDGVAPAYDGLAITL